MEDNLIIHHTSPAGSSSDGYSSDDNSELVINEDEDLEVQDDFIGSATSPARSDSEPRLEDRSHNDAKLLMKLETISVNSNPFDKAHQNPASQIAPTQGVLQNHFQSQPHVAIRQCDFCKCTETPMWRRGPQGKGTLCNACGVRWSLHKKRTNSFDSSIPSPPSTASASSTPIHLHPAVTHSVPTPAIAPHHSVHSNSNSDSISSSNNVESSNRGNANALGKRKRTKSGGQSSSEPSSETPNTGNGGEKGYYYCRYCNRSWPLTHFKNSQQFGAHCSNCSRKRKPHSDPAVFAVGTLVLGEEKDTCKSKSNRNGKLKNSKRRKTTTTSTSTTSTISSTSTIPTVSHPLPMVHPTPVAPAPTYTSETVHVPIKKRKIPPIVTTTVTTVSKGVEHMDIDEEVDIETVETSVNNNGEDRKSKKSRNSISSWDRDVRGMRSAKSQTFADDEAEEEADDSWNNRRLPDLTKELLTVAENCLKEELFKREIRTLEQGVNMLHAELKEYKQRENDRLKELESKIEMQMLDMKKDIISSLQMMGQVMSSKLEKTDQHEKGLQEFNDQIKGVFNQLSARQKMLSGKVDSTADATKLNADLSMMLVSDHCKFNANIDQVAGDKPKSVCEGCITGVQREILDGFNCRQGKLMGFVKGEFDIKEQRNVLQSKIADIEKFVVGAKGEER